MNTVIAAGGVTLNHISDLSCLLFTRELNAGEGRAEIVVEKK